MQISAVNNFAISPKFGEMDGWIPEFDENKNILIKQTSDSWGDKEHPMRVSLKFHDNGELARIKVDYKNGKYSKGTVVEEYDKTGKNINYKA